MESDHQLRLLYLYQILLLHSDVDHPLSTKELLVLMETEHRIKLHRTTIPKYMELRNAGGIEVTEIRSREKKYYLGDRLVRTAGSQAAHRCCGSFQIYFHIQNPEPDLEAHSPDQRGGRIHAQKQPGSH